MLSVFPVFVARALLLWAIVRLSMALIGALAIGVGGPSPDSAVGSILLTTILGLLDVHRRHERALWGNLGVSLSIIGWILAAVATGGEALLWLVRR